MPDTIETRAFGKTGLRVSEVGFGCGPTGGLMVSGSLDERCAVVARAVELGITLFDAAPVYGNGQSERNLGETLQALHSSELVPLQPDTTLSMADVQRVMGARRFIAENFASPLTLQKISLSCGVNREKLSRGFRELFNSTVIEALVEERLLNAVTVLRTSNLPISTIAYQCGYLNSASFTRAFGRRFGTSPGSFRRSGGTAVV